MTTNHTKCNQKQPDVSTFCNLTEQWKKGELPDGFYYVEEDGKIFISICRKHYLLQVLQDCKVLAPVPSYDEWQQLVQDYSDKHDKYLRLSQTNAQLHKFLEEFNALEVAKENQLLKELLKYCHYYIINTPVYPQGDDAKQVEIHKLSDQIINAIGEK